jgi:hypothetical protein
MDMIAWGLNRAAVTTRGDSHWTVWSISRILHNPVYAGHLRWDDLVIPSDHQPIISVEKFNQTQKKVASRIKNKKHGSMVQLPEKNEPDVPAVLSEAVSR